jgi:vacuolar-type H+-ATPase subunit F/Vma7
MSVPVFIGDELSASGYRLAGLRVLVPAPDDLAVQLDAACTEAPLVLIDAASARRLPPAQLEKLLAGTDPPVVVVPDVRGLARPDNLSVRLRRQLGVLE